MRKYQLTINNKAISVHLKELSAEAAEVEVDGTSYQIVIDNIQQDQDNVAGPAQRTLTGAAGTSKISAATAPLPTNKNGSVCAPIPGSILAIHVKTGDTIQAGQPLYKMEAMKMENEINSHISGIVVAIHVSVGDAVSQGQELLLIESNSPKRRQSD
ncbi:MAG: hypothetical protein B6I36_04900 [Desulfobacteraceae bacterium 4572_35.1]|nr:MAG: hypothetical protein B6I36_04900 [Desulfobacteraceae bacterium 4572_35.1]